MNLLKSIVMILLIILFSFQAYADFYQYTDENGNILFTDDLSKVPESQRSTVKKFVEYKGTDTTAPAEGTPAAETPEVSVQDAESKGLDLNAIKKQLDQFKAILDSEYKTLVEEKKQLGIEKDKVDNRKQLSDYQEHVKKFNEKIKKYENKRAQLNSKISEYNELVKKSLEEALKKYDTDKQNEQQETDTPESETTE